MSGILILGAGGHGKVVADILQCRGQEILGFLDDDTLLWGTEIIGVPVLGGIADVSKYQASGLILGIGSNKTRRLIVEKLGGTARALWANAIHPGATVARFTKIGNGTVVAAGAVINPGAVIGEHTIINTGSTIDHDCEIDEFVHIAPGAHLAGGVKVGTLSLIGVGANVIPYCSIGANVTIGAGAAVVKDVPDNVTAVGVPARWR